jgi:hypothetical protein
MDEPKVVFWGGSIGFGVSVVVHQPERKKDLDDLLDHLNTDATNPLAVMTQVRTVTFMAVFWCCVLHAAC